MVNQIRMQYCANSLLIAFVFIFIQSGCDNNSIPWKLDFKYSRYLTSMADEYEQITGVKSADTVEVLRIYKVTGNGFQWYSLKELFAKELVFETKDKYFIKQFVLASQENEKDLTRCDIGNKNKETDHFFVVMIDNKSNRIGYFGLNVCINQNKEYRKILIPDESGFGPIIYYNKSLVSILKTIHL